MPHLEVRVTAGTPRQTWCSTCLTSAGYEVDLWIMGAGGPVSLGTAKGCERCGPHHPVDHDPAGTPGG